MKDLRIGVIGYGFMGRTHSNAYRKVTNFFDTQYRPVLKAICGRDAANAKKFAEKWGYDSVETDWRKLVERKDIDAVDICTPNNTHKDIAIAAAGAGKMILCEKPLSMDTAEGEEMVAAVESAGVPNTVWYNYRRVPAVTLAKNLIDQGKLGKIFHYRANFLQDWTISADLPQGGTGLWRLDVNAAGSGVTGDLLAHCIDTAIWLNGSITGVSAMTETFVKQRKHTLTGKVEPVGIDDACLFHCRFGNGSLGLFESTRYARGHKALYTFEINGEHASIKWDLHDLHRLQWFDHREQGDLRGWRSIHVTDGDHPYMKAWWVPGLQIGYEHTFVHQVADFLKALENDEPCPPTFRDALETQRVCDAVLKSAANERLEDVSQGTGGARAARGGRTTGAITSGKNGRRNQREPVASASNGGGNRGARGGDGKRSGAGRRQGKR
jgi:predicted dehydrogenase